MKLEAQRIAIAEACGWIYHEATSESGDVDFYAHPTEPTAWSVHDLPDYLNDLNVMHKAEKTLIAANQVTSYATMLCHLCERATPMQMIWHATAAQRAEAFLKTLDRWTDE